MLESECVTCVCLFVFPKGIQVCACVCVRERGRERELHNVMTTSIIWHNQDESVSAELHKQIPSLTSPSPRLETLQTQLPTACWYQPAGIMVAIMTQDLPLQAKLHFVFSHFQKLSFHTVKRGIWTCRNDSQSVSHVPDIFSDWTEYMDKGKKTYLILLAKSESESKWT